MDNNKLIKVLSLVTTVGGVAISLLSSWVNDKKLNEKIDECVTTKLAQLDIKKEEL